MKEQVFCSHCLPRFSTCNSKTCYYVSGNRLLHTLTSTRNYSLRIDLEDFNGNSRYATYRHFAVGSEADGFRLSASGYRGNAGSCPQQRSAVQPLKIASHLSVRCLVCWAFCRIPPHWKLINRSSTRRQGFTKRHPCYIFTGNQYTAQAINVDLL